ncbi:hypothetical protein ACFVHW_32440 [Streptomyces sp. NPDC127110]|uniref:hypothetical protein n=1 Tax=Streptomyces sp. NPDC127110 TaxID=3345362 RepID=UPI00362B78E4
MTDRAHGYARYKLDGCRCYTCGYAVAVYNEARLRAIAYGTWQPWTDAAPVREHLVRLQSCGMGLRQVAALAGVDRRRLQAVLSGRPERGTGPQGQVRPALAVAVLAVEASLENLAPSSLVHAAGTRRRLQALVACGWPQARLAARLGWTPGNFGVLIRADRVTVRTALAVRALYGELSGQNPRELGVDNQAYSRARNAAAAASWPPPAAWDEDTIDDPRDQRDRAARAAIRSRGVEAA